MKENGKKRISTSGWETTMTKYHDSFSQSMVPYRGRILQTAEILRIVVAIPGNEGKEKYFQPADHRMNGGVKPEGSCSCCFTDRALFEQIVEGKYRVR